ncbi:cyclodeaminase/cyclohydrolase family protein [Halobellus sp. EA9]|uniref:cyclodeaminase/cyclohydrolase family protein n=1 Tax=Halobellus sp. EA9 TaxID=3421647 RepID=UPI003EBAF70E
MDPTERTVADLAGGIAAERVAPAGGTALAVSGAMGAALCEMCCVHSAGDVPDRDAERLADCRAALERHRVTLLALADQDAAVVDELFGSGSGESTARDRKRAATVPFTVAETTLEVLRLAETVVDLGRGAVVADAETGICLTESAFRGSLATARRSLAWLDDPDFGADLRERLDALEAAAADLDLPCDRADRHGRSST